jgi:anti-sigma regulatory factor (Ser/Thr protein kinase)
MIVKSAVSCSTSADARRPSDGDPPGHPRRSSSSATTREPPARPGARADLAKITAEFPAADDLILLASKLAANAITHSRSAQPGGSFAVRAYLYPGDYAWVEVIDQGGKIEVTGMARPGITDRAASGRVPR